MRKWRIWENLTATWQVASGNLLEMVENDVGMCLEGMRLCENGLALLHNSYVAL